VYRVEAMIELILCIQSSAELWLNSLHAFRRSAALRLISFYAFRRPAELSVEIWTVVGCNLGPDRT
jgi:hypothetical protein